MTKYADPLDEAAALQEQNIQIAVNNIKNRQMELNLSPKGACHWCGEEINYDVTERLFCDSDCAEDHAHYTKNKKRI